MTESRWPNEYDQNLINMTKNFTPTNTNYWTWPKIISFGHIVKLRLVVVFFYVGPPFLTTFYGIFAWKLAKKVR